MSSMLYYTLFLNGYHSMRGEWLGQKTQPFLALGNLLIKLRLV